MALSCVWSSALQSASVRVAPATFVESPARSLSIGLRSFAIFLAFVAFVARPSLARSLPALRSRFVSSFWADGPAR
jgi:hypothetical protein